MKQNVKYGLQTDSENQLSGVAKSFKKRYRTGTACTCDAAGSPCGSCSDGTKCCSSSDCPGSGSCSSSSSASSVFRKLLAEKYGLAFPKDRLSFAGGNLICRAKCLHDHPFNKSKRQACKDRCIEISTPQGGGSGGGGSAGSYICPGGTLCDGSPVAGNNGYPDQIVCGTDFKNWKCTPRGWVNMGSSCSCTPPEEEEEEEEEKLTRNILFGFLALVILLLLIWAGYAIYKKMKKT